MVLANGTMVSMGLKRLAREGTGALFERQARSAYSEKGSRRAQDALPERIRHLLEHSCRHVPWYGSNSHYSSLLLLRQNGEFQAGFRSLPIVTKRLLSEHREAFLSRRISVGRTVSTSGSTGNPMQIRASLLQQMRMRGIYRAWLGSVGLPRYGRSLVLTGFRVSGLENADFWEDPLGRRLYVNISRVDRASEKLVSAIGAFRPEIVQGYPSAIWQLSRVWSDSLTHLRAPSVVTTGEVLSLDWRKVIQGTFPRVFDVYGSQENSHFAAECTFGRMHINPQVGLCEILDDDGSHVRPGEVGRVVVTGINTYSMPLIRYSIGDYAEYEGGSGGTCECGLSWPSLGKVYGRADDLMTASDGRKVGMVGTGLTREMEGIAEAQLVQRRDGSILVRLVPMIPGTRSRQAELIAKRVLGEKLGESVSVRFEYVEELPRSARGKLRSVIVEK